MWIITKAYDYTAHGAVPKEDVTDYLIGLYQGSDQPSYAPSYKPRNQIAALADALPYSFRLLDPWGDVGYEGKTSDMTSDDAVYPQVAIELQTAVAWKIEFLQNDGHTWKAFKEAPDVPQE